jgi:hypothetical protein
MLVLHFQTPYNNQWIKYYIGRYIFSTYISDLWINLTMERPGSRRIAPTAVRHRSRQNKAGNHSGRYVVEILPIPSCPDLIRASIRRRRGMDRRVKPGHDDLWLFLHSGNASRSHPVDAQEPCRTAVTRRVTIAGGMLLNTANTVMPGLDPGIHPAPSRHGWPGQARP